MPNFTSDGVHTINDEFDNAHDLKEIRTELRRKGGTRIKTTVDNGYENLEQDDWVQLDDFDGNIAKVKEVWDVKNDAWLIVQLADGMYERVDPYSVTKAANKMTRRPKSGVPGRRMVGCGELCQGRQDLGPCQERQVRGQHYA